MKKVLILFLFLLFITSSSKAQIYSDFTLENLDGEEVTLSELLENGPVMISFWALWCVPCKEEMKKMNPIYNKYKDQGFEYLAINQDNQKSIAKVKSYISANDYDFTVLLDTDMKVFEAYGSSDLGIPYSLLINSDKEIVATHLGYVTGDEVKIEEEIIEVLESQNDKNDQEDSDDQEDTDDKKDTDDKINGTDN